MAMLVLGRVTASKWLNINRLRAAADGAKGLSQLLIRGLSSRSFVLSEAYVFVNTDMDVPDDETRKLIMLAATAEARQVDDRLALTMLGVKLSSTKTGKTGMENPVKYAASSALAEKICVKKKAPLTQYQRCFESH